MYTVVCSLCFTEPHRCCSLEDPALAVCRARRCWWVALCIAGLVLLVYVYSGVFPVFPRTTPVLFVRRPGTCCVSCAQVLVGGLVYSRIGPSCLCIQWCVPCVSPNHTRIVR